MEYLKARITRLLIDYFEDDHRRIEHALDVLYNAEGLLPEMPQCDREIVIACALLHDVGIKKSEALHGHNNGQTQEEYGPAIAAELLDGIGFPDHKVAKVAEIIGNHHSPSRHNYPELALLKEADRIVNKAAE